MNRRRQWAVVTCAAIGVLALAVQAWGYVAWLATGTLEPVRGPEALPSDVAGNVRSAEVALIIGAVAWLAYVGWGWWRRRALTWPLLWTVAWASCYWQEPLVNARNHTFSFNSGFTNVGDWTTHLPLVPDSASPLPEALVLEGLVFVALLPAVAMGTAFVVRGTYRGFGSAMAALLVGYLCVVLFDVAFELAGISQQLLAYVEIGGPALRGGSPDQWPIYEGLAIGAAWAFPGLLMAVRRDLTAPGTGETVPRWSKGPGASTVTLLAAIGAVNLVFGLYNTGYVLIMDGTTADQPSWLASTN